MQGMQITRLQPGPQPTPAPQRAGHEDTPRTQNPDYQGAQQRPGPKGAPQSAGRPDTDILTVGANEFRGTLPGGSQELGSPSNGLDLPRVQTGQNFIVAIGNSQVGASVIQNSDNGPAIQVGSQLLNQGSSITVGTRTIGLGSNGIVYDQGSPIATVAPKTMKGTSLLSGAVASVTLTGASIVGSNGRLPTAGGSVPLDGLSSSGKKTSQSSRFNTLGKLMIVTLTGATSLIIFSISWFS